jgi:hypothetical protein
MAIVLEQGISFSRGGWRFREKYKDKAPYPIPQPSHPNGAEEAIIVNTSRNGGKSVVFRFTERLRFAEDGTIDVVGIKHPEKVLRRGDTFYYAEEYIDDQEHGNASMLYPPVFRIRQL